MKRSARARACVCVCVCLCACVCVCEREREKGKEHTSRKLRVGTFATKTERDLSEILVSRTDVYLLECVESEEDDVEGLKKKKIKKERERERRIAK